MTLPQPHSPTLLKPNKPVGIIGYGVYVNRFLGNPSGLKGIIILYQGVNYGLAKLHHR